MITSNLSFEAWPSVFGDAKMSAALLDRLTHRCHSVQTGNESHRFRHGSAPAKTRIKSREQARQGGARASLHQRHFKQPKNESARGGESATGDALRVFPLRLFIALKGGHQTEQ